MAKIVFTGDLMCRPSMTEGTSENYSLLFKGIEADLKNKDYLVGNLETAVAGRELVYTNERYAFNTPESYVSALKEVGFDLLCLANNHIMDRGTAGIVKTIDNCKEIGVDIIGAYKNKTEREKVFVKEIDGIRIAFINYTYGTNAFAHHRYLEDKNTVNLFQPEEEKEGSVFLLNSYEKIADDVDRIYYQKTDYEYVRPYVERLESDIKRAKECSDFVVMIMHSGGQYNDEPEAYTKQLVKIIKNAGADIIVGHHPHIIQKSEYNNGYLVAYSLGNLVFSLEDLTDKYPAPLGGEDVDGSFSALLYLDIEKTGGKISLKPSFALIKVIERDGIPVPVNTFDLYKETNDISILKQTEYFVNRFAGKKIFEKMQRIYEMR